MKYFLRILIPFCILMLIPYLWYDKVTLNIAEFTSEYYKSIISIFIWGSIALYFNHHIESIKSKISNDSKNQQTKIAAHAILEIFEKDENSDVRLQIKKIKKNWSILLNNNSIDSELDDNISIEQLTIWIKNLNDKKEFKQDPEYKKLKIISNKIISL